MSITPAEPMATRRELDQLREDVRANVARLDTLDNHGTRGMVGLGLQLTELVKDLSELRGQFSEHERQHAAELSARVVSRRWLASFGVAALVAMVAVITLLIDIRARVR